MFFNEKKLTKLFEMKNYKNFQKWNHQEIQSNFRRRIAFLIAE